MSEVAKSLLAIHARIKKKSAVTRSHYLRNVELSKQYAPKREALSCSNLAHTYAALEQKDRQTLMQHSGLNIGIVTAYNDMLSAHEPYAKYPELIKSIVREQGANAQVAGGVPAMCDGITQGQLGMELSLFSRDVIAQATAVSLSHATFDGVICLGICDKIVPGLLVGSLSFGYLPTVFLPSGPMMTGMSNRDKSLVRQQFAKGEIDRSSLLDAELKCYHSPGTCTFYGTANTNEVMLECMGLQLPGSSFANPNTTLRTALDRAGVLAALTVSGQPESYAIGHMVDERSILNAMAGIIATGGSTNHTIHLIAIAKAAGIDIDWNDFQAMSDIVPLLARVYPNGDADVNQFHAEGGIQHIIKELSAAGLFFCEAKSVFGKQVGEYLLSPSLPLNKKELVWSEYKPPAGAPDEAILRSHQNPFTSTGGVTLLEGNLGRAIIKSSAIDQKRYRVAAEAVVFDSQQGLVEAYHDQQLNKNFIAVIRFQGPRANGMPELHQLMPILGALQDQGFQVGLVTDGRMSGASGKVPAAIHCTPEAKTGGPLAKLRSGDRLIIDIHQRSLKHCVDPKEWEQRTEQAYLASEYKFAGPLFDIYRENVSSAEEGGTLIKSYR